LRSPCSWACETRTMAGRIDSEPAGAVDPDLSAFVDRFARDHRCVGLAVGVMRNGSPLTTFSRGVASLNDARPVDQRSVFRAGSITKLFTGIAVMQLVENGALDLDVAANSYLDRYQLRTPSGGSEITLRHLLTHTSGLGELRKPSDVLRPMIGMAAKPGDPVPSLGEYYRPALTATAAAGNRWAYANHGFATLGAIVEDITGEAFAMRLRRTILEPLGMDRSAFDQIDGDLCDGHTRRFGRVRTVDHVEVIPSPAGSLYTCVDDMARFIAMVCGLGPQVLDRRLLDEMLTPQFRIHSGLPAMGLAFMIDDCGPYRMVMHDGGLPGMISHVRVAPDAGVGVVVFTNSASQRIGMEIASFGEDLAAISIGGTEPAPVADRRPELWADMCGSYRLEPGLNVNARSWALLGGEAEVVTCDGELKIRSFIGPLRTAHQLRPVDAEDPNVFAVEVGTLTVRIASGPDVLHVGYPLNATLHRRSGSFRRRTRIAGVLAVTAAGVICALSSRTRRRDRRS